MALAPRRHGNQDGVTQDGSTTHHSNIVSDSQPVVTAPSSKQEWRIFVSLSYIIMTYLACWSPFHIIFDIIYYDENAVTMEWYTFASWCCYINSAVNPILYAAGSKDFRLAMKKVFCCACK